MSRRGFTIVELMHLVSVTGIVALSAHALLLEARASGARLEAEVALQREASLVGEWLARDVRNADAVEPSADAIELVVPGERRVRWVIEGRTLSRVDGAERQRVGRHVDRLRVVRGEAGWTIELGLSRELLPGRSASISRALAVGDRR